MVSLKKNNFLYTLLILLLMNGMMSLFAQQQTAGVKTIVRYDPLSGLYIFEKKIGEHLLSTPTTMTRKEYMAYRLRLMQGDYFRERDRATADNITSHDRSFTVTGVRKNLRNSLQSSDRGVQLSSQGTMEIIAGMKRDVTDNPTLPYGPGNATYSISTNRYS